MNLCAVMWPRKRKTQTARLNKRFLVHLDELLGKINVVATQYCIFDYKNI